MYSPLVVVTYFHQVFENYIHNYLPVPFNHILYSSSLSTLPTWFMPTFHSFPIHLHADQHHHLWIIGFSPDPKYFIWKHILHDSCQILISASECILQAALGSPEIVISCSFNFCIYSPGLMWQLFDMPCSTSFFLAPVQAAFLIHLIQWFSLQ